MGIELQESHGGDIIAGDVVDDFEILDVLARSGMGSLFKAKKRTSGEMVVLKVPYIQFESDVVFYGRFEREERIGCRLRHPHIVKMFEAKEKSRPYLVLEHVEGESLRSLLQREGRLTVERALDIGRQICEALVYMHGNEVVHRDLKPENVLLDVSGQVRIVDFGIALDKSARRLTWSGLSSSLGTPDYMAPEMLHGRRGDARADLYSLGTMLYEMIAGRLPFEGDTLPERMQARKRRTTECPTHFVPDLDPCVAAIIQRATAEDPRRRFASASAILAALRDPSTAATQIDEPDEPTARFWLASRRSRVVAAAGFVLCLLGLLWQVVRP